ATAPSGASAWLIATPWGGPRTFGRFGRWPAGKESRRPVTEDEVRSPGPAAPRQAPPALALRHADAESMKCVTFTPPAGAEPPAAGTIKKPEQHHALAYGTCLRQSGSRRRSRAGGQFAGLLALGACQGRVRKRERLGAGCRCDGPPCPSGGLAGIRSSCSQRR